MTEFYIWGPKGRSPHPSIYSKDKNGNFYNYGTGFCHTVLMLFL